MESNQKVGLTKTEWILSITGIVLLVLLMVLPPLFRIIFEEETINAENENNQIEQVPSNQEAKIDDSNLTKTICMKQTTSSDYIDNSVIILSHDNNLLKVLTEDTTNTYTLSSKESESLYTEEKLSCNNTPDKYYQITGFNYSCKVSASSVQTTKKYDLSKFESTNEFHPSFILNQDITEIITSLTSEGYTCQ